MIDYIKFLVKEMDISDWLGYVVAPPAIVVIIILIGLGIL